MAVYCWVGYSTITYGCNVWVSTYLWLWSKFDKRDFVFMFVIQLNTYLHQHMSQFTKYNHVLCTCCINESFQHVSLQYRVCQVLNVVMFWCWRWLEWVRQRHSAYWACNTGCHGDRGEDRVDWEFQVSDITAPSTGTFFFSFFFSSSSWHSETRDWACLSHAAHTETRKASLYTRKQPGQLALSPK